MFWQKQTNATDNNHVEYHVKVEGYEAGEYDLVFDLRVDARAYKKSLKSSKRHLVGHIIRREYDGKYIANEKEIY